MTSIPQSPCRRRQPRLQRLSAPARLTHDGADLGSVEIRDVSTGGVFVATPQPTLPFRARIALEVEVGGALIQLSGEVVHIVDAAGGVRMQHDTGYGVQLIDPPRDLMQQFLAAEARRLGSSSNPIVPRPARAPAVKPIRRRSDEQPVVLVIDDDIRVCRAIVRSMSMIDLPTVWEDSGGRARQAFLAHRESLRVVIVDALLPDASGTDLIEEFRQKSPNLGIIAISGILRSATARRAFLRAGADDYLKKPFLSNEICRVVTRVLNHKQSSPARAKPAA